EPGDTTTDLIVGTTLRCPVVVELGPNEAVSLGEPSEEPRLKRNKMTRTAAKTIRALRPMVASKLASLDLVTLLALLALKPDPQPAAPHRESRRADDSEDGDHPPLPRCQPEPRRCGGA